MMPTVKGMSHMIPNHVLRVGQTICLDPPKETVTHCTSLPKSHHDDPDLDISLENLNQLILELDPTFELIQDNKSPTCISPPTGTVRLTHFIIEASHSESFMGHKSGAFIYALNVKHLHQISAESINQF